MRIRSDASDKDSGLTKADRSASSAQGRRWERPFLTVSVMWLMNARKAGVGVGTGGLEGRIWGVETGRTGGEGAAIGYGNDCAGCLEGRGGGGVEKVVDWGYIWGEIERVDVMWRENRREGEVDVAAVFCLFLKVLMENILTRKMKGLQGMEIDCVQNKVSN